MSKIDAKVGCQGVSGFFGGDGANKGGTSSRQQEKKNI